MPDQLTRWLDLSEENKRVFAQEGVILEATESIWDALEKRQWNKSQLAQALNTSKANVTQLLNGSRNMTLRTLSDIAFALDMEVHVRVCDRRDVGQWENLDAIVGKRIHLVGKEEVAANDTWSEPQRMTA